MIMKCLFKYCKANLVLSYSELKGQYECTLCLLSRLLLILLSASCFEVSSIVRLNLDTKAYQLNVIEF